MNLSISQEDLQTYTSAQINHFFPDKKLINLNNYKETVSFALERIDYCFSKFLYPRYFTDGHSIFNHLYSDQYLIFLYILANSIWKRNEDNITATKLYYLNKSLHAFDCMYNTILPDIFFVSHGIGTMLGKATYNNFFIVMQGCTVGANNDCYPVFGKGVALTANSSVIGNCTIGQRVTISSSTSIFKQDIADGSLVFRNNENGALTIKNSKFHFIDKVFNMQLFDKY